LYDREDHMNDESFAPEKVSSLIDNLLKSSDPATVGLRKIIRKKQDEVQDFPVKPPELEEFESPDKKSKLFNENERRVLELEKKISDLNIELKNQQEQARTAIQNAFTKGKAEGLKDGLSKGISDTTDEYEKKIDLIQARVGTFLQDIEKSKKSIYSNAEHILIRFCLEMVKKIISSDIAIHQDIIIAVVKKALSYIGDKEKLIVRVAPSDLETVSGRKDFWVPVAEKLSDISIVQDERIEQGGCIIESNSGIVDARLGIQFQELADLVEKIWENINSSSSANVS
jgi:flagellar biosynthesis/type III secretory pathway protein FliH